MNYVTFTEDNDYEGETWRFYIPIEGNEKALAELDEGLKEAAGEDPYDEFPYHLDDNPIPEAQVDYLVGNLADDTGYMPAFNKLAGQLLLPVGLDWSSEDNFDDHLYKGGIKDWMSA